MFFYNEPDSQTVQTDPYFYNTSLLLKMDSDFSDSSIRQHTVTTGGNVSVSNSEFKYDGGSGYFDGSGDYLVTSTTSDLQFGTGDFTIETWIKLSSRVGTTPAIYSNYSTWGANSLSIFAGHRSADSTKYQIAVAGTFPAIQSSTSVQYNTWIHVALVRDNGVLKFFINGILEGSYNYSGTLDGVGGNTYLGTAGDNISNGFIDGYLDDVRITKGVARYTANFTPPDSHPTTGPTEIVSTDLQLHLDAGDTNSYSGTGTTWFDLSGNGHHHTLTNPTYEEFVGAYGFNINENGKGIRDAGSTFTYGEQYTIQVWAAALPNSQAPDFRTLLRSDPNDHALLIQKDTNIIGYYDNDNGGGFVSYGLNAGTLGLENNWALYSIVGNAGSTTLYINGLSHSGTVPKTLSGNQHRSIGATTPNPVQPFGRIAIVTTYGRSLSDAEILQNFEVTKSRFGL